MALQRSDDVGFSKGLITDALGVPGALLEAQDVWIGREGELRKRGGKRAIVAVAGAEGLTAVRNAISLNGVGTLVNYTGTSGSPRMAGRIASSFVGFGTRRTSSSTFGAAPLGFDYGEYDCLFVHDGEIMSSMSRNNTAPLRWKGSILANYETGTVSTTSGSATITGAGTTWTSNAEAGMYLYIDSAGLKNRTFLIKSVNTNTSITVDQAPDATVAGASYRITAVGAIGADTTIFLGGYNYPTGRVACSHQGRVFMANFYGASVSPDQEERLRWSATGAETSGKFIGCDYWHANAYTDIGIGAGGCIKGLASLDSELVILKEGAVFALRGSVATDGSDIGARVDLISAAHGCLHSSGYLLTKVGLVFADYRGVFVYSGGEIQSLTEGRIQRAWEADMAGEIWVSAVRNRLIFTNQTSAKVYVYDIATDAWMTQGAPVVYAQVVETYSPSTGRLEYEMGFRKTSNMTDDWADDLGTSSATDAADSSYPDVSVVTHPIPLTSPVGNARPVRVDVNGFANDASELAVSIIPGRQGGTEHAVGSLPAGTSDKSHRLRVPPGASLAPYYQVKLAASGTMTDARIYAVSILSAPSGRVDV